MGAMTLRDAICTAALIFSYYYCFFVFTVWFGSQETRNPLGFGLFCSGHKRLDPLRIPSQPRQRMAAAMRAIGARKASAAATAKASYYADNEHTRTEEHRRLREAEGRIADWKLLGPYVSERAWGTVREDYSANGDAWRL